MHVQLPPLPYAEDALAPVISAETIQFHYGKHHRKYVEVTNQLLEQEKAQARTLEELVRSSSGKLFNNAGQVWNHNFYWQSLSAKPAKPGAALRQQLERDFGSYEAFVDRFCAAAVGQFGSGWAWLVQKDGKLEVMATSNAESPMAKGIRCLLTVDVWEHAYYIDYRNERDRYAKALVEQRLNWDFAERNLTSK
ncbi:MAG TPA: superoxide dismutase [Burkholderiales bacterium]|nr:superoxide dismutase [Burkholderiales bacterium]